MSSVVKEKDIEASYRSTTHGQDEHLRCNDVHKHSDLLHATSTAIEALMGTDKYRPQKLNPWAQQAPLRRHLPHPRPLPLGASVGQTQAQAMECSQKVRQHLPSRHPVPGWNHETRLLKLQTLAITWYSSYNTYARASVTVHAGRTTSPYNHVCCSVPYCGIGESA